MTDEDFLTRIRRLQGQQSPVEDTSFAAKMEARKAKKAADAKYRPNMVVGIRVDPARITLPKLKFMGEQPDPR